MTTDLVIDANVLAHACNPNSEYFDSALTLVEDVITGDVHLAIDDTGKDAPAVKTSRMYMEYEACTPPGSIARSMLQLVSETGRLDFLPRPARQVWMKCKTLVPRNQGDAIVLGVGVMSASNLVASNDYDDFPLTVRSTAKKKLGVDVLNSQEMTEQ